MFNVSVILNSRGRVPLLKGFLQSLKENTAYLDRIEVLIKIDDNDLESIELARQPQIFDNIKYFITPRPVSLNSSLNFLAREAKGYLIWGPNDDSLLDERMLNWDKVILDRLEEYKKSKNILDDIVYIGIGDTSCDHTSAKYASFPILTKKAVEVLGFWMDESFPGLGADNSLAKCFLAIDRCLWIPELVVRHVTRESVFQVLYAFDQTTAEMRAKSNTSDINPETYDVTPQVNKLKKYIENFKK